MLISGEETLAKSIKSEVRGLITDGLFLIHHTGFGSSGVTSIWSVFSQLDASSVTTSNYYQITACTRVRYWASYQ